MPRLNRADIDEILRLYHEEGYNQTEVAEQTGHSRNTVSKYVNDVPEWSEYATQETAQRAGDDSWSRASDSNGVIDGALTATAVEHFENDGTPATLAKEAEITIPTALKLYDQYQEAEAASAAPGPRGQLDERMAAHERLLEELARHLHGDGTGHLNPEVEDELKALVLEEMDDPPGDILIGNSPPLQTCGCEDDDGIPVVRDGELYCEICGETVFEFGNRDSAGTGSALY